MYVQYIEKDMLIYLLYLNVQEVCFGSSRVTVHSKVFARVRVLEPYGTREDHEDHRNYQYNEYRSDRTFLEII
jgi:hypothetical protein